MSNLLIQRYLDNRIKSALTNYGAELAEVRSVKDSGLIVEVLPLVKTKDTQSIKGVLVAQSKYMQSPLSAGDFVLLLKTAYTIGDFATSGKVKSSKNTINYIAIPLTTKSDIDKATEAIFIGNQIASLRDIFSDLKNALDTLVNVLNVSFTQPAVPQKPLDPAFSGNIKSFSTKLEALSQKIDKVLK